MCLWKGIVQLYEFLEIVGKIFPEFPEFRKNGNFRNFPVGEKPRKMAKSVTFFPSKKKVFFFCFSTCSELCTQIF